VKVTVSGHPEYGHTFTRANGMFDLAVNGGALLTLEYEKAGLLPAQRQVQVPWQDYAWLPEVVLIPLDSRVTAIALDGSNTAVQVAQGNPVTDADGTRQATVLFPPDTQASLVMPDGSTRSLATLQVRATEYTIGTAGPRSMPGELPASSGYTYAVELSVDEALRARAKEVRFSQPLPVYVDNFLGFPVGGIVPAGWYDRDKAAWVPSDNGRVVKVLNIQDGLAQLDTDGDGTVDSADQLAALGVTDAERTRLAELYPAGHSVWRVPVSHFTPWDYNWPVSPPDDAQAPNQPELQDDDNKDECESACGSVIAIQNQTLGERVGIAGTPFSLHYQSDRVPGRTRNRLSIPLSGASIPASLKRIELDIQIAGRHFHYSFPATPNQIYDFEWDGKDAYDRALQGSHLATIDIGYVYDMVYRVPAQSSSSFGAFGGSATLANRPNLETTLRQRHQADLEVQGSRASRLAGWTLNEHHAYDPTGLILHRGDGSRRSVQGIAPVISTVFPASQAAAVVAPDGSLYVANNNMAWKVGLDRTFTAMAGNGQPGFSGDGGPATQASLAGIRSIALSPDGSLYIADGFSRRVRRVSPSGIITTVAGNGELNFSGDGGPATEAAVYPSGIAVGPDGSLYIADNVNNRIRKVSPSGIITTVAGNGELGFSGNGGPAAQARLFQPHGIALGPDGSFYIAESFYYIRKVSPSGIITIAAGSGNPYFLGDGGPATAAGFHSAGIAVGPDGSLYIADGINRRVRKVSPTGIITTVAGNGEPVFSGDGGPATQAGLGSVVGVAPGPMGSLYITADYRIRKLSSPFPGFDATDHVIPSEDGVELYQFNAAGRHLTTRHARTGGLGYAFSYSNGLLAQIQDGDGNTTRIERDASGNPLAIVAPDGQRTTLTLDMNGWLASIASPAGETHRSNTQRMDCSPASRTPAVTAPPYNTTRAACSSKTPTWQAAPGASPALRKPWGGSSPRPRLKDAPARTG
jgi:YD repeat-containing protein